MPSHPMSYMQGWGLLTLERGSMWWHRLYMQMMDLYPRAWQYRTFVQSCAVAVRMSLWWWEIVQCIPRLWGRRSLWWGHLQSHIFQSPLCRLVDRGIRRGPWPSNAQANCEVKVREVVWGVRSELIGILATQAASFCPVSLGQVPRHLLIEAQWTWLYPFNRTCD